MARLQILLAENDDDTRDLYSFMLANAGVHVMAVRNGLEALILTDVAMPVVSGVELIKIVKSRVDYADLPVIAMTAHGEKIRRLALSAGANMAMHKPIRYDELRDAIDSALDRPEA
jgi:two-component system, sensor histidine kinase and response regulator